MAGRVEVGELRACLPVRQVASWRWRVASWGAFCLIGVMLLLLSGCFKWEYKWEALQSPTSNHLRGLYAVSEDVVWASGANGTVIRTTNGGDSWEVLPVPGAEELDFRDIHALDQYVAWVLSAGNGVSIYRTDNGGQNWHLQYHDPRPEAFYDGFDFTSDSTAMAYGDPIDGQWSVLTTTNFGADWEGVNYAVLPPALEGEGGYAASGTGVVVRGQTAWLATGGGEFARVLRTTDFGESWQAFNTPLVSAPGAGIFSMAFSNDTDGIIVGGNYVDSASTNRICAVTRNAGETWTLVGDSAYPYGLGGYRSCVAVSDDGSFWLATGRNGWEWSRDHGWAWDAGGTEAYYSCAFAGDFVFASGRGGKLARMRWRPII